MTAASSKPRRYKLRRPNLAQSELHDARLDELLGHGLNHGDENLARGVLRDVRAQLSLIVALSLGAEKDIPISARVVGSALDGVLRRIEVASELLERERTALRRRQR